MSKALILKTINRGLSHFNLNLTRKRKFTAPSFASDTANHFSFASMRAEPVLVLVPTKKLRWKTGRIPFDNRHPFVNAAKIIMESGDAKLAKDYYSNFYAGHIPKNCADIVDCFVDNNRLNCFSLFRHKVPWPWVEGELRTEPNFDSVFKDGAKKRINLKKYGSQNWGPVTPERIHYEASRIEAIVRSVERDGLLFPESKDDKPITGQVLRNGQEWVCIVDQGQHRAAVSSAMGIEEIPVLILGVVDLDFCSQFPNVQSGLYTRKEADKQFGDFLKGKPIPLFEDL